MTMVTRWTVYCDGLIGPDEADRCPCVVRGEDGQSSHEVWRVAQRRGWTHDGRTGKDRCTGVHAGGGATTS